MFIKMLHAVRPAGFMFLALSLLHGRTSTPHIDWNSFGIAKVGLFERAKEEKKSQYRMILTYLTLTR